MSTYKSEKARICEPGTCHFDQVIIGFVIDVGRGEVALFENVELGEGERR